MKPVSGENRVRERRRALGMSQRALADMVGITRSFLIRIEQGLHFPRLPVALRLAAALQLSVEELFWFEAEAAAALPVRQRGTPEPTRGLGPSAAGGRAVRGPRIPSFARAPVPVGPPRLHHRRPTSQAKGVR